MIFVDTGAWVARFSRRDQYHERAAEVWAKLKASEEQIITSNAVFVETVTLLGRKVSIPAAVSAGRFLLDWNGLVMVRATGDDESDALKLMDKFADQSIGFVDCLSFALMRRYRISAAFTFDRHFEMAGFTVAN